MSFQYRGCSVNNAKTEFGNFETMKDHLLSQPLMQQELRREMQAANTKKGRRDGGMSEELELLRDELAREEEKKLLLDEAEKGMLTEINTVMNILHFLDKTR